MTPKEALKTYWGYDNFREPQEAIITNVLDKKDSICLLPTGGGKSLCYQIPALIIDGIAVVISPLISLMQDQVQNLVRKGVKAKYLQPGITRDEIVSFFDNLKYNNTKIVYLSPERFQSQLIIDKLKTITISFLAVDEAHCLSEWGHDFRPSFLQIKDVNRQLGNLPILALTASANQRVILDIKEHLNLKKPKLFRKSFERTNLAYQVFKIEDKNNRLLQIANKMKSPIIVYSNTRKRTENIADFLNNNGFHSTFYHGGLSLEEKKLSFEKWMNEKKQIMVATNAFGMGIDKENVGVVIHMDLPFSVENYFQEAGRAGRGGKKSFAVLLWNKSDIEVFKNQFYQALPEINFIKDFLKKLYQNFQIPNGQYTEAIFDFEFYEFCQQNSLSIDKSKNTLQILNNNGILEVSKDIYSKSTLKILVEPNQINTQVRGKKEKQCIDVLLRSYTGLFYESVKINEYALASKLKTTSQNVKNLLNHLHTNQIVSYKAQNQLQTLQFLVPREDKYCINRISKRIKSYLDQREEKMKSLIEYVESNEICRSQWLLNYFDEKKTKPCEICDICLGKKKGTAKNIESNILDLLSKQNLSSQEIFVMLNLHEDRVLESIKMLLKKEKIRINFQNKYCLNE